MQKPPILIKSHTAAFFPILIALEKFKEHGIEGFTGFSQDQKFLLSLLPAAKLVKYSENEIKTFISDNVPQLNSILKNNGFDIQLDESKVFELGVVTIMDLVGKWLAKADLSEVIYKNQTYPAAKLKAGASIVRLRNEEETEVLMIRTTNGPCVFIEKTDEERDGIDLFHHVRQLSASLTYSEEPCDATIPFVDIDDQPDMNWLLGLQATNEHLSINQALQQNRLKINLDGIHAESATVLGVARGLSIDRREFIVDQPFNIWLAYGDPELKYFPLFAAYVAPQNWKEPK